MLRNPDAITLDFNSGFKQDINFSNYSSSWSYINNRCSKYFNTLIFKDLLMLNLDKE